MAQLRVARLQLVFDCRPRWRARRRGPPPAARAVPRPRPAPPAAESRPCIVRTRSTGATSPSRTLRIGFTLSSVPASAAARPIRPPRCRKSAFRAAPARAAGRELPRAVRRSPPAAGPACASVTAISANQPIHTETDPESTTKTRCGSTDSAARRATSKVPLRRAARFRQITASCCWSCSRKAVSKATTLGEPVLGSVLLVRSRA